jgi:hypothetical protein
MANELYKVLYDAEWTRRDQLQAAVSTPLTALTFLGGALLVLVNKWNTPHLVYPLVFRGGLACAGIALAVAVFYLIRSYHGGEKYERIPFSSTIRDYESSLLKEHLAAGHTREVGASNSTRNSRVGTYRPRISMRRTTLYEVSAYTQQTGPWFGRWSSPLLLQCRWR